MPFALVQINFLGLTALDVINFPRQPYLILETNLDKFVLRALRNIKTIKLGIKTCLKIF